MNTRTCEYMIAIAEQGTLSKAAQFLGITQPTLSNFLANTEQQLGHTLFSRQQKTMLPTEKGRIYLEACQRIVETKKITYSSILGLSNNYAGRFSVGATPHRGSSLFARIYSRFYQRHPEIMVDLQEAYISTLLAALDAGEVDLVIGGVSHTMLERYAFIQNNQEELLLCVPDFHPLAALAAPAGTNYACIDIKCFQDTPFVMWGQETANYQTINRMFRENGMSPTIVYESNNALFIDNMLTSGIGVGFLPVSYCRQGQNRVYFSMSPPLSINVGIYYRRSTQLSDAQRYFVYLVMRDQVINGSTSVPRMNEEARRIYNEFREVDDGYATA